MIDNYAKISCLQVSAVTSNETNSVERIVIYIRVVICKQ